jgi:hypothetical protein
MFKRSKFFLCVAQKMNYEDGITFTENNIVSYLAELEEYISSLITYTAFKREDSNAPISSIPLEKLNTKEFSKKTMFVSKFNLIDLIISYRLMHLSITKLLIKVTTWKEQSLLNKEKSLQAKTSTLTSCVLLTLIAFPLSLKIKIETTRLNSKRTTTIQAFEGFAGIRFNIFQKI